MASNQLAEYVNGGVQFASIGATTADALYAHGVKNLILAPEPKLELLVRAIVERVERSEEM